MIRILGIHLPIAIILLCIIDIIVMYISLTLGLTWSYAPDNIFTNLNIVNYSAEKALFTTITFITLITVGAYYRPFLTDMKLGLLAILIGHFLAVAQLALVFYVLPDYRIWLSALLPATVLSVIGIVVSHLAFDRAVGVRLFRRRVLVLGNGNLANKAQETIARSPYLECVAYLSNIREIAAQQETQQGNERPRLAEAAAKIGAQAIIIAFEDRRGKIPVKDLLECRLRGIYVVDIWSFVEREDHYVELEGLNPSWFVFSDGFSGFSLSQKFVKRLFDIVASLGLLVVVLPVLILVGLAVVIDSGGTPFYRQTRVGIRDRRFTLWKLRTMRSDAEADGIPQWSDLNDSRVTRVGRVLRRVRVDELPQLFNVLLGDMSIVGPRPERPEIVTRLIEKSPFYEYRHTVKPGISGWAQIHYPYGNTEQDSLEKLKYDLYYIKNCNLALDFIVLLQTLRVVIWPSSGTREKIPDSINKVETSLTSHFMDSVS